MKTSAARSVAESRIEPRRPVGRPRGKARVNPKFGERRHEVLLAAARTFNAKGFHRATLDDVANELGVTKPAIYYYARSKDELLFACGKLALDALGQALDKSQTADMSGLDRLKHFFRLYGEVICEDFGRCLATSKPRDLAPKSRRETISRRREINHAVRAMIADGIKDGSIRKCDERAASLALFDAFNGLASWFDHAGPLPLKTVIANYLSLFLSGLAKAA